MLGVSKAIVDAPRGELPTDVLVGRILLAVTGGLSIGGTLFVLYKYSRTIPKYRTFHFKLVAQLCSSDLVFVLVQNYYLVYTVASGKGWTPNELSFGTVFSCFVQTVCVMNSFFVVAVIAHSLYCVLIAYDPIDERVKNPVLSYAPYSYCLPLLIAAVPACTGNYRASYPDYQITSSISTSGNEPWRNAVGAAEVVVTLLLPFTASLAYVVYCVWRVYARIIEIEREVVIDREIRRHARGMLYYPILLAVLWLPIIVQRIIKISLSGAHGSGSETYSTSESIWNMFEIPLVTLQGFLNSIVYGCSTLELQRRRSSAFDALAHLEGGSDLQDQTASSDAESTSHYKSSVYSQYNVIGERSQKDSTNAPGAIKPHFSYHNMKQFIRRNSTV